MKASGAISGAIALAVAIAAAVAPGCDGGPIGTGISGLGSASSVAGSVAAVPGAALGRSAERDGSPPASLPPGSVVVSVEGLADASVPVGADGSFAVTGSYHGPVVLRFDAPDRVVRIPVDVPVGALVVLPDIVLAESGAIFDGGRALNLVGRVVSADCGAGEVVVELASEVVRETRAIAIDERTRITGPDGRPADCEALSTGTQVLADGRLGFGVDSAFAIEALGISIDGERAMLDQGVGGVSFDGNLVASDCSRGLLALADASEGGWVSLDASAATRSGVGSPVDCREIAIGDRVRGAGRLRLGEPAVVAAETLSVDRRQAGSVEVRLAGRVVDVDCTSGRVATVAHGVRSVLRLGERTALPQGIDCGQIPNGAWMRGLGRIDLSGPIRIVEALQLSLWQPGADFEASAGD